MYRGRAGATTFRRTCDGVRAFRFSSYAPGDTVGVPREGRAVFLDALCKYSNANKIHTAIHELGHVFSLPHDLADASFMGVSSWYPGFSQQDEARLNNAGSGALKTDLPGASNFQGSDGTILARRRSVSFRHGV
jgi:hypothetical protein